MTQVELRDLIVDRVGWKQPTGFTFTLSAEATSSDSGLYFQDAYPMIKLNTLLAIQADKDITESDFNTDLVSMKQQNALMVVADVLDTPTVFDEILTGRENIFDDALMKRMAILVGEMILTSNRSNMTERLSKEQIQQLFFEINGNSESSGSNPNPNFPTYVGLKSRYGAAIHKVKDLLRQGKSLDTYTQKLPFYDDDENNYFIWPVT